MTASSGKNSSLPKNVLESDPINGRHPSLNYPRWRIELASALTIITYFWRIRCIGKRKEESENESFWSASVQGNYSLAFKNCFLYITGFRLFLLLLQLNHLSTCYSPLFSKLRETTQGMAALTQREVDHGVRATLRLLSEVDSCPVFRSRFKQSKEGFDFRSEHLKVIESQVDG